ASSAHFGGIGVYENLVFLCKKKVLIVLETRMQREQDRYAVSPIGARLPLRKSECIFLKSQAPHRAFRGEYLLGSLLSARTGSKLPVRRTGLHAQDRSDSRPRQSGPPRLLRE